MIQVRPSYLLPRGKINIGSQLIHQLQISLHYVSTANINIGPIVTFSTTLKAKSIFQYYPLVLVLPHGTAQYFITWG